MSMILKNRRAVLVWLVLVVLINSSPLFSTIPGIDSGIFLYTARQMLRGDVPYRDMWDHKAPGIYFVDALALLLTPDSRWGLWILEVVSLWMAVLLSFETLKTAFGESSAFWGTVVWVSSFILIYEKGNFSEEFALPLKFATISMFLQGLNGKKYGRYGYLIGLAAGFTFFIKQNLLGISIVCIGHLSIWLLLKKRQGQMVKFLLASSAGFASVSLLFLGYFAANDALDDFWDAAFRFNFVYISAPTFSARLHHAQEGISALFGSGIVLAALLGWFAATIALYKNQFSRQHAFLSVGVIAMPLEFLLSSLSGKAYLHYYLAWLPVMGLLVSFFIHYVSEFTRKELKPQQQKQLHTGARLLMLLPAITIFNAWLYELPASYEEKTMSIAEIVKINTHKDDRILVWGHNPTINFLADRVAPTRFIYQTPLFNTEYGSEEIFAEFYMDITTNPPVLIVEDDFLEIPTLDSAGIQVWNGREIPQSARSFFDFVAENYVQMENKALYRYIGK